MLFVEAPNRFRQAWELVKDCVIEGRPLEAQSFEPFDDDDDDGDDASSALNTYRYDYDYDYLYDYYRNVVIVATTCL